MSWVDSPTPCGMAHRGPSAQEVLAEKDAQIRNAPYWAFDVTSRLDASLHQNVALLSGRYFYKGLHQERPYYQRAGMEGARSEVFLFYGAEGEVRPAGWHFGPTVGGQSCRKRRSGSAAVVPFGRRKPQVE